MTKDGAIQSFFESFEIPAFPSTFVPSSGTESPEYPYLTYSAPTGSNLAKLTVIAKVYYRSESWLDLNAKVREISQFVGDWHLLQCDEGAIIVRKSTPFAQPYGEESDDMIKSKILSFEFLFATTY